MSLRKMPSSHAKPKKKPCIFTGFLLVVLMLASAAAIALLMHGRLFKDQVPDVGFDTVSQAVLDASDLSSEKQGDNQTIKRYYGLDPASFDQYLIYYPNGVMDVDELLLVRVTDPEAAKEVVDAAHSRIDTQKANFNGYGTNQTELLNKSVIEQRGNYVLLVVADNADQVKAAFEKTLS